jgi:predicted nuclease of restriction endonuclease-like (RecB) superfamily
MARKKTDKPKTTPARTSDLIPAGYEQFLKGLKQRIRQAQLRASLSVNRELIELYWSIGKDLVERQQCEGWGKAVIDRLGKDLQKAFPGMSGFSRTNVYRMRAFYLAYEGLGEFVPQAVGQIGADGLPLPTAAIPWGHNVVLIEQVKDPAERLWYARATVEQGWSRSILRLQIEGRLYHRQGKAVTNFETTLPNLQSDLARQILKDPYNFDFLSIGEDAQERELERGLLEHIRSFLLELGVGFAFVGSQYHLEVGGDDFYIDLLFYHLKLRAYVVIELKTTEFRPEYAGKMNFYLSAVDDLLRHPQDEPSIGLILCKDKEKNKVMAEYALRDVGKPIGISGFKLAESLPDSLQSSLPTIADLEAELSAGEDAETEAATPPRKSPRKRKS